MAFLAGPIGKLLTFAFIAAFAFGAGQYSGRIQAALNASEKTRELVAAEEAKHQERLAIVREQSRTLLLALGEQRAAAPIIIRDLENAPATECSGQLISDVEWDRLRDVYWTPTVENTLAGADLAGTIRLQTSAGSQTN